MLEGWSQEALVAVALSLLTNAAVAARWIYSRLSHAEDRTTTIHTQGWAEVRERDRQIDLLRRMMDRMRSRENAYATALELALIAMKLPQEEQADIAMRIRGILQTALPGSGDGG